MPLDMLRAMTHHATTSSDILSLVILELAHDEITSIILIAYFLAMQRSPARHLLL